MVQKGTERTCHTTLHPQFTTIVPIKLLSWRDVLKLWFSGQEDLSSDSWGKRFVLCYSPISLRQVLHWPSETASGWNPMGRLLLLLDWKVRVHLWFCSPYSWSLFQCVHCCCSLKTVKNRRELLDHSACKDRERSGDGRLVVKATSYIGRDTYATLI